MKAHCEDVRDKGIDENIIYTCTFESNAASNDQKLVDGDKTLFNLKPPHRYCLFWGFCFLFTGDSDLYTVLCRPVGHLMRLSRGITYSGLFLHVHIIRKQSRRFLLHAESLDPAEDRLYTERLVQVVTAGVITFWSPAKAEN